MRRRLPFPLLRSGRKDEIQLWAISGRDRSDGVGVGWIWAASVSSSRRALGHAAGGLVRSAVRVVDSVGAAREEKNKKKKKKKKKKSVSAPQIAVLPSKLPVQIHCII